MFLAAIVKAHAQPENAVESDAVLNQSAEQPANALESIAHVVPQTSFGLEADVQLMRTRWS